MDSDMATQGVASIGLSFDTSPDLVKFLPLTHVAGEAAWPDMYYCEGPFSPIQALQAFAMMCLFDRSWFTRLRVWQEVLLATNIRVLCGIEFVV
jgi:hypothetical protein